MLQILIKNEGSHKDLDRTSDKPETEHWSLNDITVYLCALLPIIPIVVEDLQAKSEVDDSLESMEILFGQTV